MPTPPSNAAHEPVQALINRWWELGLSEAADQDAILQKLEQTLGAFVTHGEQVSQQLAERTEQQQCLEHDIASLRNRVTELERTVQERTEELLRAQAANNTLAAQAQQTSQPEPPEEQTILSVQQEAPQTVEMASSSISEPLKVNQRFSQLRERQSAAG